MLLRNSLAHLVARVVALGAGIIAIPLVTLTLGTEALGLVGVYATLQAVLGFFDLGLPVTVNHRLAIMIGRKSAPSHQAAVVRALEILFWGLAALFLIIALAIHEPLAASWLRVTALPHATVESALVLMIFAVAVRFPVTFYSNVLFAYDRHIYPNAITAISAVIRTLTALGALVFFRVGIVGYFTIQLIGSAAEVALLGAGVLLMQPVRWVRPRLETLREIGSMAGWLTLISVSIVALTQIDKIILSKLLNLSDFGFYVAGYTYAAGLAALSYPVGNAVFPQLTRSLHGDRGAAAWLVRAATELTILILVPMGCVLIAQPAPVLQLLFLIKPAPATLGDILPLMILGGLAQAFVTLPHLFQVAAGRLAAMASINGALLIPFATLVFFGTRSGGIYGAAVVFAAFNITRLLIYWMMVAFSEPVAGIWRLTVLLAAATIVGGLTLASVFALLPAYGLSPELVAIASIILLTVLIAVLMPISRQRLLKFRTTRRFSLND